MNETFSNEGNNEEIEDANQNVSENSSEIIPNQAPSSSTPSPSTPSPETSNLNLSQGGPMLPLPARSDQAGYDRPKMNPQTGNASRPRPPFQSNLQPNQFSQLQNQQPNRPHGQPHMSPQNQPPHWNGHFQPAEKKKTSRSTGVLISAVVLSLLVGSAAGYGGSYLHSQMNSTAQTPVSEPGAITINNPDRVNMVTAVAAKASPSVVTLDVSQRRSGGTGSGVILTSDGYVLTNNHVVTIDGATSEPRITVKTHDGTLYNATIVATDPVMDLAVVKLENASGLSPIEFADSDNLNIGEETVAIGSPLGLEGTVTQGVISSLHRSINVSAPQAGEAPNPSEGEDNQQPEEGDDDFFQFWRGDDPDQNAAPSTLISLPVIQTDAAINPGNSGGALLNAEGQLIGINVAIATTNNRSGEAGSIGVGFAIPSNLAQRIAKELIEVQAADHGLLGATIRTAALEDSSPAVAGATIVDISPGSAADQAGLKINDVITRFNGIAISSSSDLTAQVRYLPSESEAELVYYRNGKQHTTTVTLGAMPTP